MKNILIQIVPTGVGAEIGGYVGDATPSTNLLGSTVDNIIVHPNVVNGVLLNAADHNAIYVEGYMLDKFLQGEIGLRPVRSNKIGVILDIGAKDKESIDLAIDTIEAIRTNKGVKIIGYELTKKPVGAKAVKTKAGAFVGELKDATVFLKIAQNLITKGATAIAIGTMIQINKKDLEIYFKGKGPNPYGGTEALISRTISKQLNIPAAHAPLLRLKEMEQMLYKSRVDPRAAAEAVTQAYLGCILQGLHKAAQPIPINKARESDILLNDVLAVVIPATCMGGIPALAAAKFKIPIIAVKENKTILNVTGNKLNIDVINAENYLEATGIALALKQGISLDTIRRPIHHVKQIK
ncbi:DUF3326 domain-containing protein [Candidatus Woesearchaeota archaeon]|nr:DUF3326 domain-containing protein [Candidatus Woesearchaeota archaeon]